MPERTVPAAEGFGRKLYMACRCAQFDEAQNLLDSIDDMKDIDRDTALEYTDKQGNTHLHMTVQAPCEPDENDEKLQLCSRLLKLGFIFDHPNKHGKSCYDLAPADIVDLMRKAEKGNHQRKRGNSLIGEGATLTKVSEVGFVGMAAIAFKRGAKRAQKKHEEEQDHPFRSRSW